MNAIEIRNLTKIFGETTAVNGLDMTVPEGAIYGFIGENGSGKSTTEKLICGLIHANGGSIKLYGKDHTDGGIRSRMGSLIEMPGCFPNMSVWNNLLMHAYETGIKNSEDEIRRVLTAVHMEGSASNKFKNCSLGMRQRIGIAMALLGNPRLLILDEPINGLDADGMRIMREILTDLSKKGCTVVISSHILSELEKIATHYGIIKGGKMIKETTAEELNAECPVYVAIMTKNQSEAKAILLKNYSRVEEDDKGYLRVYGTKRPEDAVTLLYENGVTPNEVITAKINLEEYYADITHKEAR